MRRWWWYFFATVLRCASKKQEVKLPTAEPGRCLKVFILVVPDSDEGLDAWRTIKCTRRAL